MTGSQKVTFPIFYLECKQVTVGNTWVSYRHVFSLFFGVVTISVEAPVIAADQRIRSLGGKMMHPADLAIA
jgi:hypothetical protein